MPTPLMVVVVCVCVCVCVWGGGFTSQSRKGLLKLLLFKGEGVGLIKRLQYSVYVHVLFRVIGS